MAVRLHRIAPASFPASVAAPTGPEMPPAPAAASAHSPVRSESTGPVPSPSRKEPPASRPAFPPPSTLSLKAPPRPLGARRTRLLRGLAAVGAVAAIAAVVGTWAGRDAGGKGDSFVLAGTVDDASDTVAATAAGELVAIAAAGAVLERGALLARVETPAPPSDSAASAEVERLERDLGAAERGLSAARVQQVRIERLYKSERATRTEREDAGRLVRTRSAERDRIAAAIEEARAKSRPAPPAPVELRAPERVVVTRTLKQAGTRVGIGEPLAEIAPAAQRATVPNGKGRALPEDPVTFVVLGDREVPARLVDAGPDALVVEFDPGADRIAAGTPVELRVARSR